MSIGYIKPPPSAGVTDHGALTGLPDDDHTQYQNDGRADTWLGTKDTDDLSEGTAKYFVPHSLGGPKHNADTLANLNAKMSDATLISTSDSRLSDARTPVAADETTVGGGELATQVETNTGTDDTRIVTPLKLANATTTKQWTEPDGDTFTTTRDVKIDGNLEQGGVTPGANDEISGKFSDDAGVKRLAFYDVNDIEVFSFNSNGETIINNAVMIKNSGSSLSVRNPANTFDNAFKCATANVTALRSTGRVSGTYIMPETDLDLPIRTGNARSIKIVTHTSINLIEFTNDGDIKQFSQTYGGTFGLEKFEGVATLSGASTVLTVDIPDGSVIRGYQRINEEEVTSGDGATTYKATLTGGATDIVESGIAFAKNEKRPKCINGIEVDGAVAQLLIEPDSGTFSGGKVVFIFWVDTATNLDEF